MISTLIKIIVVFISLEFFEVTAQAKGDFYKDVKKVKKGELLCLYNQTMGYSYLDENGIMKGFSIDLMEQFKIYLKSKEGIDISLKFEEETVKDFGMFLSHIKTANGGVFGLGGITITEVRLRNYRLSSPIMKSVTIIVTHKDVPDFGSLNDLPNSLKSKVGYSVKGTTFEQRLKDIQKRHCPSMELMNKQPGLELFEKVLNQKNTIQNIDFVSYLSLLKRNLPLKRQPVLDMKEEICIVMAQNNDWNELFEKFLTDFMASPSYRKLISDNFGTNALKFLDSVNN